ncbi:hypothetical protein QCB44_09010 [Thiomicrorhabdus sp. zzn3]|uniref:hypothetical protein n=1 Tax=Thiomicrorhabdus sp. zzn3 TaxID=3039775 RepID=UPI002436B3F1|nr:hypothetical protein [Thiomicrorhabdus sp. zzn3]MDG6778844.1 hypothetical protein [Thiomicrorhabdus sp. zzn3]
MVGKWSVKPARWRDLFATLLGIWLSLWLLPAALASTEAKGMAVETVEIKPQSIMLGEPLTIMLRGPIAAQDFHLLPLHELQKTFAVYEVDQQKDRVKLTLYPLQDGEAVIPALKFGRMQIPQTRIEVRSNPHVRVTWSALPEFVYPSQNLPWNAQVWVDDVATRIHYEHRDPENWQVQLEEQAVSETVLEPVAKKVGGRSNPAKEVALSANYVLQDQQPNLNKTEQAWLNSPAIEVRSPRQRPWRFFDRSRWIEVRALPGFLPQTVVVGKVDMQLQTESFWHATDEMTHWIWRLQGDDVSVSQLRQLAYELQSQIGYDKKMEWLNESFSSEELLTEKGVHSRLEVHLPYRVLHSGVFVFPELMLRTFDPQSGVLQSQVLAAQSAIALPKWLYGLLAVIGLLAALAMILRGALVLRAYQARYKLKRQIQNATSIEAVVDALIEWQSQQATLFNGMIPRKWFGGLQPQKKEGSPHSGVMSLGQLVSWYQHDYGDCELLNQLTDQLNRALYAKTSASELKRLQESALSWVNQIPLRWKSSCCSC